MVAEESVPPSNEHVQEQAALNPLASEFNPLMYYGWAPEQHLAPPNHWSSGYNRFPGPVPYPRWHPEMGYDWNPQVIYPPQQPFADRAPALPPVVPAAPPHCGGAPPAAADSDNHSGTGQSNLNVSSHE